MWQNLLDFFFPCFCPVCGAIDELLCHSCKRNLGYATQICPICEEESVMGWTHLECKKSGGLDGLVSLYEYDDPGVRKVVDNIKYDFNKELIGCLFEDIFLEVGLKFDFVVPVPLHFYRYNWRGFNQAELMGKVLCSQMPGTICENLLIRKINTTQQVKMTSRAERQKNVVDAFGLNTKMNEVDLKEKKVLLVDDVFTTGASMGECSKVLKDAGVKVVWVFTLAH